MYTVTVMNTGLFSRVYKHAQKSYTYIVSRVSLQKENIGTYTNRERKTQTPHSYILECAFTQSKRNNSPENIRHTNGVNKLHTQAFLSIIEGKGKW